MKFGLILLFGVTSLLAAGCATHQKAPGATFDRIGQEMQGAVEATAKGSADSALNQAMLPPLQLDLPESAKSVEPRFDLAVSNAPAAQVFMALVSGTRYSMLVAPEVSGTVTVNLKSVTVREALETLRELYGYEFKLQGTRIYIQPNTMQTRIFQLNYLAGKRVGQSDVRVISGSIATTPAQSQGANATRCRQPNRVEFRLGASQQPDIDHDGQRLLARLDDGSQQHCRDAGGARRNRQCRFRRGRGQSLSGGYARRRKLPQADPVDRRAAGDAGGQDS